ncbi:hypothetical protein BV20DRAFT_1010494 [Pilatotrama ljubarskyi]|nr:hypothetical protein BV20DRAFT_1010494 [Pilatotrama ljubarskyi]
MPNMPLDVLTEIFSVMHPRDVLNLARTSAAFRGFLMSRNSAPFWRAARRTVNGLPDCPPHLSEPEYANLMFFSHCHSCLTTNVHNVIFEFSVRYCRGCKNWWVQEYGDYHGSVVATLKESTGNYEDILNLQFVVINDIQRAYYHDREWAELQTSWEALPDYDEAGRKYVQDRAAAVRLVKESCDALYAWKDAQVQDRAEELDAIRAERFNTLLEFLMAEGWTEELNMMQPEDYAALTQQQYARRAVKLTPRGWANIRADAHAFMEDVQNRRLAEERRKVLYGRFEEFGALLASHYPANSLRAPAEDTDPTLIDLAILPFFRDVLDAPGDDPLEIEDSANMRTTVATWIGDWRESCKVELAEKLVGVVPDITEVADPLSLAIAIFLCECHHLGGRRVGPLRFPDVLAHSCTRREAPTYSADLYVAAAAECANAGPLVLDKIRVDTERVRNMRAIIEALGLDYLEATLDDLERSETRLRCEQCNYRPRGDSSQFTVKVEAFDWLRAFKHYDTPLRKINGRSCSWTALSAEEARAVRIKETRERMRLDEERARGVHYLRYGCGYCAHDCVGSSAMGYHLRHIHEIGMSSPEAGMGAHTYVHLDNDPPQNSPIWLKYYEDGSCSVEQAV